MKKQVLSSKKANNKFFTIALGYFTRWYLVVFSILSASLLRNNAAFLTIGIIFIVCGVHLFVGYKLKWKHILCAYQNWYHEKMNPDLNNWSSLKKSDVYGVPILFIVLGVLGIIAVLLF